MNPFAACAKHADFACKGVLIHVPTASPADRMATAPLIEAVPAIPYPARSVVANLDPIFHANIPAYVSRQAAIYPSLALEAVDASTAIDTVAEGAIDCLDLPVATNPRELSLGCVRKRPTASGAGKARTLDPAALLAGRRL